MYHLQTDQALKVAAEQRADRMRGSERSRLEGVSDVEKSGRNRATSLRTVFAILILAGVLALVAAPLYASEAAAPAASDIYYPAPATLSAQSSYRVPEGYFIQEKMYHPAATMQMRPAYLVPSDYFMHEKTDRAPGA